MKDKIISMAHGAVVVASAAVFIMVCLVIVLFLAAESVRLYATL